MTKKTATPDFSDWSTWALQVAVTAAMGTKQAKLETITAMLTELAKRKGFEDVSE